MEGDEEAGFGRCASTLRGQVSECITTFLQFSLEKDVSEYPELLDEYMTLLGFLLLLASLGYRRIRPIILATTVSRRPTHVLVFRTGRLWATTN